MILSIIKFNYQMLLLWHMRIMLVFETTTGILVTGKPYTNMVFMGFISRCCEANFDLSYI